MSALEDIVRAETANSAVAFRERAYADVERQGLLRDVIGLANAPVVGPRYLFMGVRYVVGGERTIVGISRNGLNEARAMYQRVVSRFVEPPLTVEVRELHVDGLLVGAMIIKACDDPPYLLAANVSNTMRRGNGWIRRGTECARLARADLQRMFEAKYREPAPAAGVLVGFPGRVPQEELVLPILSLTELPSEVAGARIRKLLEAKEAAKEVFGRTETGIDRLVHAQVFSGDVPYERHSEDSLARRLNQTPEHNAAADEYYELEVRAHKLNLVLVNVGESPVEGATLVLGFPRLEGVGIAERIVLAPGADQAPPPGYPVVDTGPRTIRVQASVGEILHGSTVRAFRQPLRLWLREAAAGKTLPVDYHLHAKNLREPLGGTLRIRVEGVQSKSSPPSTSK